MRRTVIYITFIYLIFSMASLSAQSHNVSDDSPYTLSSPNPNPFKDNTTIQYTIRKSGFVSMKVYNLLGNEVGVMVNENKSAGTYFPVFDAKNLPKGIYFCRFTFGNYSTTRKLIIAD
jgi:hypothetical protein